MLTKIVATPMWLVRRIRGCSSIPLILLLMPSNPTTTLATFSASIVNLMLPAEPLDGHAVFIVAALMVFGFEDHFQNPADFKPFPQLALDVFHRLDPAQKFAVAEVLKGEAAVTANRGWETVSWEQYMYQRSFTAWQCGWDIACLLMHWYSEGRLPSARTNQSLQLNRQCAAFTDKVGLAWPLEFI